MARRHLPRFTPIDDFRAPPDAYRRFVLDERALSFELGTLEKEGWVFDRQRAEKEVAVIYNFEAKDYEKRQFVDGRYEEYVEPRTYTRSSRPAV